MDNTKDHACGKEYQAERYDAHGDQRNRDDLFKEKRILGHM
jgi:hypothetical protein